MTRCQHAEKETDRLDAQGVAQYDGLPILAATCFVAAGAIDALRSGLLSQPGPVRGTCDDGRSFEITGGPLWPWVTRSGGARAFCACEYGAWWRLGCYIMLGEASGAPAGLRDGS